MSSSVLLLALYILEIELRRSAKTLTILLTNRCQAPTGSNEFSKFTSAKLLSSWL